MSVTQISRIQQRRGRKNTNYGFPQLASGELGWAIDTQELYIGNGAVSEGAPYVGNSKILTEHDDILQFVALYQYKNGALQTGPSPVEPVSRSLQNRLDDLVSIKAFGAVNDGSIDPITNEVTGTDNTDAFQRAIDQLFLNIATKQNASSRVVLYIDPGVYVISGELRIPPYAYLIGSGIDSTIIVQILPEESLPEPESIIRMVDGNSNPGDYISFPSMTSLERPRNILISGLTLQTTLHNRIVYLDNTDSSLFDKVKFVGLFVNGIADPDYSDQIAVEVRGASPVLRSDNVLFHYCIFNNIGSGIYSESDHNNINIENCVFYQLREAINIGGGLDGAVNTGITNCYFDLVDQYGVYIKKGFGNSTNHNKFMNVGNNNQGYFAAEYENILFDTDGNQTSGDYFERNTRLKNSNLSRFVPCVKTSSMIYDNISCHKSFDITYGSPREYLRFPLFDSGKYMVDYVINKEETEMGAAVRTGSMTISVNLPLKLTNIVDSFEIIGAANIENLVFSVSLEIFRENPEDDTPDTLIIKLYNPPGVGSGVMNYTYRMLSK